MGSTEPPIEAVAGSSDASDQDADVVAVDVDNEEHTSEAADNEGSTKEGDSPAEVENRPSDEGARKDADQGEPPVEESKEAVTPAVSGGDLVLDPHQALDMDSLEKTIPEESPRQKKGAASMSRAASRLTSFRQGMTRDERLKSMVSQAKGRARQDRLGKGTKSVFQANMDDIGALGIGMQLYFMLTKYLSVTFLCMGIISLPSIMVNTYGHGITSKMVDPLQLAYSSIGNGGVNSDTAASARSCLPIGDIDCTWNTVDTPLTSNPRTVTWIVTITDVLYSLVFMCFLLFYSYCVKKVIKEHQNKHLTPGRYAVMVRGLPTDATEKEILDHFNELYDPTTRETYRKLWFGCCWGKRHKAKRSQSKKAVNKNVVSNVDHLEEYSTITRDLYLNTWIAEVSVAHPTGGLLRTYLSRKSLRDKKEEAELLVRTLEAEKSLSPVDFKAADEKLIHATNKKLVRLEDRLEKKRRKIKIIKEALPESEKAKKKKMKQSNATSKGKIKAAAKAAKKAATNTLQAFDWGACECAFVVFNNLESRRRCLQDYRQSTRWLSRKWQPTELRFRHKFPLIVTTAPEPSNILWENLETTERGRFYRQFVTNLVTVLLLVISCAIISAAQSAQEKFASKSPPDGLCDQSLPAVYYGDTTYALNAQNRPILWSLAWDQSQDKSCTQGSSGEKRYHITYTNGILNNLDASRLSYGPTYPDPVRCVDPCISESSTDPCNTLPCFYYDELVTKDDMTCEEYITSNVLYCFCSTELTNSIQQYGFVQGPKKLWDNIPCRQFTKDYLVKNSFMLLAAGIVVIVNFLLNNILRMFAVFERHTSESTKTIRVAVRMFGAQFLNTAVIVMLVNASFGLSHVPVAKDLLGGKFRDFQRGWYPAVGMGITTTMLLNAFLPQITLFMQMYVVAPIYRWRKRRSIRTQAKMDKLYAGPPFDISQRYAMVLNSVFVTMVFCGGMPILLFIAVVASTGIYWFDKLSILHLYSVKTTYDEILGGVTIQVLPWTLALHLGFSAWMYGNTELLKGTVMNLPWLLRSVGLKSVLRDHPNATSDELYALLVDNLGKYDVLGQYGFLVKIVFSHVMLMTVLCFMVTIGLSLYTIFGHLVFVVLGQMLAFLKQVALVPVELIHSLSSKDDSELLTQTETLQQKEKDKLPVVMLPEFTEPFVMSVSRRYKPDEGLGFQKSRVDNTHELTCLWPEDVVYANGMERVAGERKLTWETMQAPVKSYAIEANEKYRHAVKDIMDDWELVKKARGIAPEPVSLDQVAPVLENQAKVESALTATENIKVVHDAKTNEDSIDAPTDVVRPEEVAVAAATTGPDDETVLPVDEETKANSEASMSTDEEGIKESPVVVSTGEAGEDEAIQKQDETVPDVAKEEKVSEKASTEENVEGESSDELQAAEAAEEVAEDDPTREQTQALPDVGRVESEQVLEKSVPKESETSNESPTAETTDEATEGKAEAALEHTEASPDEAEDAISDESSAANSDGKISTREQANEDKEKFTHEQTGAVPDGNADEDQVSDSSEENSDSSVEPPAAETTEVAQADKYEPAQGLIEDLPDMGEEEAGASDESSAEDSSDDEESSDDEISPDWPGGKA